MPFLNIVGAATTVVRNGQGILKTVTINQPIASATVTIYDNTAGSGTKIATITLPATLLEQGPKSAVYELDFGTGLTIVTTGAGIDVTVSWR